MLKGKYVWSLGALATGLVAGNLGYGAMHPSKDAYIMGQVSQSNNWSGYIDEANNTPFTDITGSWTVPTVTGAEQSANAQWIGLGGVTSSDLLQIGTLETVQNGKQVTELFWEQLPQSANMIAKVNAGDKVTTEIKQTSAGEWQLTATIVDGSQTTTKTVTANVDSAYANNMEQTAEWISEDPEDGNGQILPFAQSGTVTYTNATVNGSPIRQSGATTDATVMVDDSNGLTIVPSSLDTTGTSFSTAISSSTPSSVQGKPKNRWRREGRRPSITIPIPSDASNEQQMWNQLQQMENQLLQQWSQLAANSGGYIPPFPTTDEGSQGQISTDSGSSDGWQWTVQMIN